MLRASVSSPVFSPPSHAADWLQDSGIFCHFLAISFLSSAGRRRAARGATGFVRCERRRAGARGSAGPWRVLQTTAGRVRGARRYVAPANELRGAGGFSCGPRVVRLLTRVSIAPRLSQAHEAVIDGLWDFYSNTMLPIEQAIQYETFQTSSITEGEVRRAARAAPASLRPAPLRARR